MHPETISLLKLAKNAEIKGQFDDAIKYYLEINSKANSAKALMGLFTCYLDSILANYMSNSDRHYLIIKEGYKYLNEIYTCNDFDLGTDISYLNNYLQKYVTKISEMVIKYARDYYASDKNAQLQSMSYFFTNLNSNNNNSVYQQVMLANNQVEIKDNIQKLRNYANSLSLQIQNLLPIFQIVTTEYLNFLNNSKIKFEQIKIYRDWEEICEKLSVKIEYELLTPKQKQERDDHERIESIKVIESIKIADSKHEFHNLKKKSIDCYSKKEYIKSLKYSKLAKKHYSFDEEINTIYYNAKKILDNRKALFIWIFFILILALVIYLFF